MQNPNFPTASIQDGVHPTAKSKAGFKHKMLYVGAQGGGDRDGIKLQGDPVERLQIVPQTAQPGARELYPPASLLHKVRWLWPASHGSRQSRDRHRDKETDRHADQDRDGRGLLMWSLGRTGVLREI